MNLKEQRVKKGMTQVDVAKAVGVSLVTYRLWEESASTPKEENKKKLIKVLDVGEGE